MGTAGESESAYFRTDGTLVTKRGEHSRIACGSVRRPNLSDVESLGGATGSAMTTCPTTVLFGGVLARQRRALLRSSFQPLSVVCLYVPMLFLVSCGGEKKLGLCTDQCTWEVICCCRSYCEVEREICDESNFKAEVQRCRDQCELDVLERGRKCEEAKNTHFRGCQKGRCSGDYGYKSGCYRKRMEEQMACVEGYVSELCADFCRVFDNTGRYDHTVIGIHNHEDCSQKCASGREEPACEDAVYEFLDCVQPYPPPSTCQPALAAVAEDCTVFEERPPDPADVALCEAIARLTCTCTNAWRPPSGCVPPAQTLCLYNLGAHPGCRDAHREYLACLETAHCEEIHTS